jgi:mRNA interferase MazF
VFSEHQGLPTQVAVGVAEGLKHDSAIQCDGLMCIEKSRLTEFVGTLGPMKMQELDRAIVVALALKVS